MFASLQDLPQAVTPLLVLHAGYGPKFGELGVCKEWDACLARVLADPETRALWLRNAMEAWGVEGALELCVRHELEDEAYSLIEEAERQLKRASLQLADAVRLLSGLQRAAACALRIGCEISWGISFDIWKLQEEDEVREVVQALLCNATTEAELLQAVRLRPRCCYTCFEASLLDQNEGNPRCMRNDAPFMEAAGSLAAQPGWEGATRLCLQDAVRLAKKEEALLAESERILREVTLAIRAAL